MKIYFHSMQNMMMFICCESYKNVSIQRQFDNSYLFVWLELNFSIFVCTLSRVSSLLFISLYWNNLLTFMLTCGYFSLCKNIIQSNVKFFCYSSRLSCSNMMMIKLIKPIKLWCINSLFCIMTWYGQKVFTSHIRFMTYSYRQENNDTRADYIFIRVSGYNWICVAQKVEV